MRNEATPKNKRSLWLILALVALLAAAGVLLAILLPSGKQEQSGQPAGNTGSVLYWNLDRVKYMENSETGLSTRERAEDGLYHVRLLGGGELIEVTIDDPKLVNFLDSLKAVGLVTDADGLVVDLVEPKAIRTEIVKEFYVKRQTEDVLVLNSSLAMNGMDMEIPISDSLAIYDVAGEVTEFKPATCSEMDKVYVYGDMASTPTEVFIVEHATDAEIYWRLEQKYDSKIPSTTRVPDENGVYTITFAYKGQQVDLKCKDKVLVTSIDSASTLDASFGLLFDEEGYITGKVSVQLAIRGMRICDRYEVETLENGTFTAKGYFGNTSGKTATSTLRDDCEVYLVCDNGTVQSHIGEKTELQQGDRILCYTDLSGNAKLIYVLNRRVDSQLYYNVTRKFGSGSKQTTRTPDEKGYYEIVVLNESGKKLTVRTKDKALATAIDTPEHRTFGLKLKGDIVEAVYDQESVTGMMVAGIGRLVVDQSGTILSIALARSISQPANMLLADDCKIYNVTGDQDGAKYGSQTQLRLYDEITAMRNLSGKITHIYVTRRYVTDAKLYWNLEAKYVMEKQETSRTPNSEGYYVYTMACEGQQVQVKTKSKDMASWMDSRYPKYMALKVDKNGIVRYGYDARSLVKAGYYTSSDYRYDYLQDGRHFVYYLKGEEKVTGGTVINDTKGLKIYDISNNFELLRGEKTKLRKDDKVQFIISLVDNSAYVGYVTERKLDIPLAKNRTQMYNSSTKQTTRTPDADGYYVFELAVDGQLKQYKTKDKAIASRVDSFSSAFALKAKDGMILGAYNAQTAKNVSGLSVGRFDVTTINGSKVTFTRNRPTSSNYGATMEKVLSKKCKVYDISPYAESFGAEVELQLGDRVEAYANADGELIYIYIVYACTREEGPISLCDHCNKEVWWEPYVGDNYAVTDIHYYFPAETTIKTAFGIGSNVKPVVEFGASGKINAYKGAQLVGGNSGSVTILEENPVSEVANAMTFPADGSDYEALCPSCNETVTWKAMTGAVWHKVYNPAGSEKSHFYVPKDYAMTRTDKAVIDHWSDNPEATMCIHLNGKTVTSKSQITVQKSILNIMGTGAIQVDCSASAEVAKAAIYVNHSSGVLNMYGGKIESTSKRIEASCVLDLNGQTVNGSKKVAQVYGSLDIYDTVGGGSLGTLSASGAYGGVLSVNEGGVINLHSGTLTMDPAAGTAGNGGVVMVGDGGTFNMLGGAITGGNAQNGANVSVVGTFNLQAGTISGGTATQNGGNVQVYMGGVFNMQGGEILGGTGSAGGNVYLGDSTFNLSGGLVSGGNASRGGNFRILDGAVLNLAGGEITDGSATSTGGNISLQATSGKQGADGKQVYATVNMTGGKLTKGAAGTSGGNINLDPYSAAYLNGGTIENGIAPAGSNLAMGSVNVKLTLGNTVTGGEVFINKANTTTLTGKAIIDRLVINPGITVTLGQLTEDAAIKVSAEGGFTKSNENAAAYLPYFTAADQGKTIANSNNVLVSYATFENNEVANQANLMSFPADGSNYTAMCPVCNKEVTWRGVKNGGRASSSVGTHFYLAESGSYSHASNAFIFNNAGTSMCFHLNGKTFTTDARVEAYKGTLNIMGKGELRLEGSNSKSNVLLLVGSTSAARLNLYGGTFTANAAPVYQCAVSGITNVYEGVTLNGNVDVRLGNLNLQDALVNGAVTLSSGVTLDGHTRITKLLPSLTGKVTIKESFTGAVNVDFPVYEPIEGAAGYGLVYASNATLEGALNGSLTTSAGKAFTAEGGRLKVQTDKFSIAADEVSAAAEQMQFPTGQSNGAITTAYCPACNQLVDWIARANDTRIYSASGAHFYMTADSTIKADNSLFYVNPLKYNAEVLCVHLNGRSITAKGEIYVENGTLNIMGKGKLTTDGTATTYGTTLFRVYDSVVNLFGGNYAITAKKPLITFRNAAGILNAYGTVTFTVPSGTDLVKYTAAGTYNDYRETE